VLQGFRKTGALHAFRSLRDGHPTMRAMDQQALLENDISAIERQLHEAEIRLEGAKLGSREYHAAARDVAAHWHMLRVARARRRGPGPRSADPSMAAA
jgi:hypothetical protein